MRRLHILHFPPCFVQLGLGALLIFGVPAVLADHFPEPTPAPGSTWEPETCIARDECGDFGPLIPKTYNQVGAGLIWTSDHWDVPMIHYKGRHSEFKPTDVVDEACMEQVILDSGYTAWPIPREEWGPQFPTNLIDPNNIYLDSGTVNFFDPIGNAHGNRGVAQCFRSSFKHLVYGGYNIHQGQSLFVANRIRAYWHMENAQTWDLRHPDAFANRGIFDNALLDEEDALMNLDSFIDTGASRGLHYSIYSLGYATLADGRILHVGGHNMNSASGFRKLNILDPETLTWAERPEPCNIANWRADPGGVELGYQAFADAVAGGVGLGERLVNPPIGAPTWPDCDQRDRDVVDPPHPSDMRYQRWYPSGLTLPDGRALIYSGVDLDESVGPDETIASRTARDAAFRATRISPPVPEVYDPETDTTVALESARKLFPHTYPAAHVIQTGPRDRDWKACVVGGQPAPAAEATIPRTRDTDPAAEWRLFCTDEEGPGCANDTRAIAQRNWERPPASLDCLDVQAALADPDRNFPAENHWTHIDTAQNEYMYRTGHADIVKIGPRGETLSHKMILAGGRRPFTGATTADIEVIDFADPEPKFELLAGALAGPSSNLHLVALPDGTVYIRGGSGPGSALRAELFNPDDNTVRTLAKSTHRGGLHKAVMLLHDATVINMAGDRSSMVPSGDRMYSPGDGDLGVSVAQVFYPSYLFDAAGTKKIRPVIEKGPDRITYRQRFVLDVDNASRIQTVSMVRTGFVTHHLHNDNRLVMLHFQRPGRGNALVVDAPHLPAQAVPGDYMVFVVDEFGTPSVAKRVRLHLPGRAAAAR